MKNKIVLSALLTLMAAAAFTGLSRVAAVTNPQSTLVQKLAEQFNLKEADVQSTFDELRQQRRQDMQSRLEEELSDDVKLGKITEAQKQAIVDKHQELQANRDKEWQLRQQQRQELENWAAKNGLDLSNYFFGHAFGRRGHGGFSPMM